MNTETTRWLILITLNVCVMSVLCFYNTTGAAPRNADPPFNNSVQQRENMIRELREIKVLLKEQNALLKSGVRVVQNE